MIGRKCRSYERLLNAGFRIVRIEPVVCKSIEQLDSVEYSPTPRLIWKEIDRSSTKKHCKELLEGLLKDSSTLYMKRAYWRVKVAQRGFIIIRGDRYARTLKYYSKNKVWKQFAKIQCNEFMDEVIDKCMWKENFIEDLNE